MTIWAVDPGAVATGVAWIDGPIWGADQYTDPGRAYRDVYMEMLPTDVLLVEDFSHGGAFTLEAKQTLEVVGFFIIQAQRDHFKVIRRHKDKRLSGQGPAAQLMGESVAQLKKDPKRKDAFSALAHCVVYQREVSR